MPNKPLKPCAHFGCPALTAARRCPDHTKIKAAEYAGRRNKSWQHLYGARWRRERKAFLASNPLCAGCARQGRITVATIVDHIIPHKGDLQAFWDKANRQGLCENCHNVKTASEGAFGQVV